MYSLASEKFSGKPSAHAEVVGKNQKLHLRTCLLVGQEIRVSFAWPHRESKVKLKHTRCQLSTAVTGCRGSAVISSS